MLYYLVQLSFVVIHSVTIALAAPAYFPSTPHPFRSHWSFIILQSHIGRVFLPSCENLDSRHMQNARLIVFVSEAAECLDCFLHSRSASQLSFVQFHSSFKCKKILLRLRHCREEGEKQNLVLVSWGISMYISPFQNVIYVKVDCFSVPKWSFFCHSWLSHTWNLFEYFRLNPCMFESGDPMKVSAAGSDSKSSILI